VSRYTLDPLDYPGYMVRDYDLILLNLVK